MKKITQAVEQLLKAWDAWSVTAETYPSAGIIDSIESLTVALHKLSDASSVKGKLSKRDITPYYHDTLGPLCCGEWCGRCNALESICYETGDPIGDHTFCAPAVAVMWEILNNA